jgi:Ca-activated chloride channel family protein
MRSLLAGLALLVAAEATDKDGIKLEALRYNSVERTRSGMTALENGDATAAIERFDSAKRLENTNPVTFFNAATARLIAGQEGAADQLQQAIEVAPEHLQPSAHYNLGNARLAEENPAAAVDAYKQVLRLEPAHMDAKFNLELAQRLLQQQQQQQQQNQESPEGEQSEQAQDEQPQPQEEPEEEPGEQPEEQRGSGEEEQEERQSPLPDFENQEDMTAEQAAAILEAVENLEREQRRQQAAERARKRTKSGKDW